jgi:phosphatidylserine/phosphatidylglycerophosphate/cardiolipin synthase-like enzyme
MKVFFGGPDKPPYYLRNLLAEKIDEIGLNGEIFWITYYFRDLFLVEKLINAAERGAKITILLEARPRIKNANLEVINLLKSHSKINIKAIRHSMPHKHLFSSFPKIHEKLYYFKNNNIKYAFIGSFNPSGRADDDPKIIESIGDQDRGHNFLIEIDDNLLLDNLYNHCVYMYNIRHGFLENIKKWKSCIESKTISIHFFPWANKKVVFNFVKIATTGDRIYIAVSHFTSLLAIYNLIKLAKKGVTIKVISHDTKRRFPLKIEKLLNSYNIPCIRYNHPKKYPMHNKFIILERETDSLVAFGSLNLTVRSLNESHEIFYITNNLKIVNEFKLRWLEMEKEIISHSYGH